MTTKFTPSATEIDLVYTAECKVPTSMLIGVGRRLLLETPELVVVRLHRLASHTSLRITLSKVDSYTVDESFHVTSNKSDSLTLEERRG